MVASLVGCEPEAGTTYLAVRALAPFKAIATRWHTASIGCMAELKVPHHHLITLSF